jgi:hypothetical protein
MARMATIRTDFLFVADLHVTQRQNAVPIAAQHREREKERKTSFSSSSYFLPAFSLLPSHESF